MRRVERCMYCNVDVYNLPVKDEPAARFNTLHFLFLILSCFARERNI